MKKIITALILALPLSAIAATTATAPAAAPTVNTAATMVANIPTFLTKLDTLRGKALSATEKAAVTGSLTQSNTLLTGIQNKFMGSLSKASGIEPAVLEAIIPSPAQAISNSDLTKKIESKAGKKLSFLQTGTLKAANALRNNSLAGLKTNVSTGVANKVGMDPAVIESLLPLLGF